LQTNSDIGFPFRQMSRNPLTGSCLLFKISLHFPFVLPSEFPLYPPVRSTLCNANNFLMKINWENFWTAKRVKCKPGAMAISKLWLR